MACSQKDLSWPQVYLPRPGHRTLLFYVCTAVSKMCAAVIGSLEKSALFLVCSLITVPSSVKHHPSIQSSRFCVRLDRARLSGICLPPIWHCGEIRPPPRLVSHFQVGINGKLCVESTHLSSKTPAPYTRPLSTHLTKNAPDGGQMLSTSGS